MVKINEKELKMLDSGLISLSQNIYNVKYMLEKNKRKFFEQKSDEISMLREKLRSGKNEFK